MCCVFFSFFFFACQYMIGSDRGTFAKVKKITLRFPYYDLTEQLNASVFSPSF